MRKNDNQAAAIYILRMALIAREQEIPVTLPRIIVAADRVWRNARAKESADPRKRKMMHNLFRSCH